MSLPTAFNVHELFQPSPDAMPVIDPGMKDYGRLWIRLEHFESTKALRRWLNGVNLQPSLCLLHQNGQCHGGPKCNQAHVGREYMAQVRQALNSRPFTNCCLGHGDLVSKRTDFQSMLALRGLQLKVDGTIMPLQPDWIAMTSYFDCYLNEMNRTPATTRPILIDRSRICNLHQRQECKYGPDCRNIHLCREIGTLLPEPMFQPPVIAPIVTVPAHALSGANPFLHLLPGGALPLSIGTPLSEPMPIAPMVAPTTMGLGLQGQAMTAMEKVDASLALNAAAAPFYPASRSPVSLTSKQAAKPRKQSVPQAGPSRQSPQANNRTGKAALNSLMTRSQSTQSASLKKSNSPHMSSGPSGGADEPKYAVPPFAAPPAGPSKTKTQPPAIQLEPYNWLDKFLSLQTLPGAQNGHQKTGSSSHCSSRTGSADMSCWDGLPVLSNVEARSGLFVDQEAGSATPNAMTSENASTASEAEDSLPGATSEENEPMCNQTNRAHSVDKFDCSLSNEDLVQNFAIDMINTFGVELDLPWNFMRELIENAE